MQTLRLSLGLLVGALLLQMCKPASPADFVGAWKGKIKVRIKRPDGKTSEETKSIRVGILPDPDNEKGLIVSYNNLPLRADIKGRSFVVRESDREKIQMAFSFLFMAMGGPVEMDDFSLKGTLSGTNKMDIYFKMSLSSPEKSATLTHEGTLERVSGEDEEEG